jgi:hypothetical protein
LKVPPHYLEPIPVPIRKSPRMQSEWRHFLETWRPTTTRRGGCRSALSGRSKRSCRCTVGCMTNSPRIPKDVIGKCFVHEVKMVATSPHFRAACWFRMLALCLGLPRVCWWCANRDSHDSGNQRNAFILSVSQYLLCCNQLRGNGTAQLSYLGIMRLMQRATAQSKTGIVHCYGGAQLFQACKSDCQFFFFFFYLIWSYLFV